MKKNQIVHYILIAWAGAIATTYNACGGFLGGGFQTLGSRSIDPVPVFEKTVYPLLVQHCGACHAEVQAPLFSAGSVQDAWDAVQGSMVINSPEKSRLVQRLVTDAHQCWEDCEESGSQMLAKIVEFKELVNAGPAIDNRISLGVQTIPAEGVLPNRDSGNYKTYEWSLAAIEIKSATFAIDIQEYGPGTYRFNNPRFKNLPVNLQVRGLAFKLNGTSRDRENTYYAINIEDTELTNRRLSSAPMQVVMEMDLDGKAIEADLEPVFDIIEAIDTTPRATPTFTSVLPMLTAKCNNCHGGTPAGGRDFRTYQSMMTIPLVCVNGTNNCNRNVPENLEPGRPSVAPGNFVDSLIYQSVAGAQNAKFMPQGGAPISQSEMDTLIDWILGGALQ